MQLTKLPFPRPVQIYRSVMPFSSYDPNGELIESYKNAGITMVVMLISDSESLQLTGHDLKSRYQQEGFKVLYLPIPDFGIPSEEDFEQALTEVVEYADTGGSVAIHCHAGLGRTGMFVACLAKREMGFSSEEAVRWVREVIPGAVEVPKQEQFVRSF